MIKISAVVEAARGRRLGKATIDDETAEPIELGSVPDRSEGRTTGRNVGIGIHQFADSQSCGVDGLGAFEHNVDTFVSSETGSVINFGASVEQSLRSQFLTRRKLLNFMHGLDDGVHAFGDANLVGRKLDTRKI